MKNSHQLVLLLVGIAAAPMAYSQGNDQPDSENQNQIRPGRIAREQYERELINAYKAGYRDALRLAKPAIPPEVVRQNSPQDTRNVRTENSINQDKSKRSAEGKQTTTAPTDQPEKTQSPERNEKRILPYKAFTGGFYVGANSTRYRGEDVDGQNLTGRLGYQVGVFTRFGGRLYGQLGAEYFTSSSNFFTPGDSLKLTDISGRINTQWIQVPVYVGFKLAQSKRGISGVRLAVGAEYANRIGGTNTVQLDNAEIKRGTFLALGNLGFDLGPLMIDIVYHHGLSDALKGFADSQRRSLGLNVGFKF